MNYLEWAHGLTQKALSEGPPLAVDATVGNGWDTLHLATCSQPRGHVWGFDVQEAALQKTSERLVAAAAEKHVVLAQICHSKMEEQIPLHYHGRISAVMFNLGYLPGGDTALITRAETTLPALEASLRMVRAGGVITVVIYPGHPGSDAEAVSQWIHRHETTQVVLETCRNSEASDQTPYALALYKKP